MSSGRENNIPAERDRENLPFLCFAVLFKWTPGDWMMPTQNGEVRSSYNLLIEMLISPRNTPINTAQMMFYYLLNYLGIS